MTSVSNITNVLFVVGLCFLYIMAVGPLSEYRPLEREWKQYKIAQPASDSD